MMTTTLIVIGASLAYADTHGPSPFRTEAAATEVLASDLIGMRVYTAKNELATDAYYGVDAEWNDVGEINDVILKRDGMVEAGLIDIHGFLGLSEKPVAVDLKSLAVLHSNDGDDLRVHVDLTKEELEAMQTYVK